MAQKDSCKFILVDTLQGTETSGYYLTANINNWDPQDENYRFKKEADGTNSLICVFDRGTSLEFKFTKGGWDKVECNKDGSDIGNHRLNTDTAKFTIYYIGGWKNSFAPKTKSHTASINVRIVDTAFYMPQLDRNRRIWIYLPVGYATNRKQYPVMYMHDGQNIFDEFTAGFGEWGIDECLDSMIKKGKPACIVVGIDCGPERMNEYNPYDFKTFGQGEGDKYIEFLVKTLKPFIDRHYRTLPGKENTIIAGSSMGGLISYYAMLRYPDVFGKAGIFSPSFWTADGIKALTDSTGSRIKGKLFFYIGSLEGKTYVNDMNEIVEKLGALSGAMIYSVIDTDPGSRHNEKAWRKWFAEFYNWVMADGFNNIIKMEE